MFGSSRRERETVCDPLLLLDEKLEGMVARLGGAKAATEAMLKRDRKYTLIKRIVTNVSFGYGDVFMWGECETQKQF